MAPMAPTAAGPRPQTPSPGGWQGGAGSDLRALLRDLALLDPHSAHGVTVRLQKSLSSTTTTDTDTFDVSGDFDLAVYKVTGLLAFDDLPSEPFTVASYNVSPVERAFLKAQNCRVELENPEDRGITFLDESLFLNSILPPFGDPIVYVVPYVAPRGRSLKATFTLIDTTGTNMVGAATTFGIRLDCAYVRVRSAAKQNRGHD